MPKLGATISYWVRSATITKKAPGTGRRYRLGFYWQQHVDAKALAKFLGSLDAENKLAKRSLITLTLQTIAMMATMAGNFNDDSTLVVNTMGSAWWFLDQKYGMEQQLQTLSNMGLLGRFVGMLTDSRSFFSYPRHEYFRRILCNLLAVTSKTECCRMILNGRVS